ncbi:hypothetical protein P3X46_014741 [Hevea brasiliensis]|uniref:Glycosyl transferase CAP10 domain-containing protein n=1 Tax=Hevea brasiliensis TaxID=3981 RepID=A0ABQ9LVM0_HEVBR|nr:uncharacterized protein LOC110644539 [Hevea brasiliensis]KAJ9171358.1 hypothetical protein P3X46_014741 [Hevea brasiliensis]
MKKKKKNNEKSVYTFRFASGLHRHFLRTPWQPLNKRNANTVLVVFFLLLFLGALIVVGCFDTYAMFGSLFSQKSFPEKQEFPLKCTTGNLTRQTCTKDYPRKHNPAANTSNASCPSYFRWIHEDLRPWRDTGITREMIERARRTAHFRLVIVDGKAYVDKYKQSIQTRDAFTLWGILQLMRWYPGRLPDLELMFDCDDRPVVRSKDFQGPNSTGPPPLFRYCADGQSLDIVFPDWSFWGWAETNIRPWKNVLKDIKEGNKRTKWKDRTPYAYWKGNPNVAPTRKDLLKCNVSHQNDWNTRLYIQDWNRESKQGYKQSNLQDQCTHRYKIYIEGWAWSVSEKYILACDSMTLYVKPRYHDFFIRGMLPLQHYWPIRDNSKCTSLKFAVEWGNNHTQEVQAIGEAASNFIQEDMKMDYIYDYMFHLLNEYAKLLKYKPTIPAEAVEVCSETMGCPANGTYRKFMLESMVMSPSDKNPCTLPPPYDLRHFLDRKAKSIKQVEMWENEYWHNLNRN